MRKVSFQQIRASNPPAEVWRRLIGLGKSEADDFEVTIHDILRIEGLDDALWCLRVWPEYANKWRILAVRFARQVEYLMTDKRSVEALDVAERYANGNATDSELWAARAAAEDAVGDAEGITEWDAARAARAAVGGDGGATVWDAGEAAMDAEGDAVGSDGDAAWGAARAAWKRQRELLTEMIKEIETEACTAGDIK